MGASKDRQVLPQYSTDKFQEKISMEDFYIVNNMSHTFKYQTDLSNQNMKCCLDCFKQTVQRGKRQLLCLKYTGDIQSQQGSTNKDKPSYFCLCCFLASQ